MDTVGTFEVAKALATHQVFTTIHKHYSVEEWTNFYKEVKVTDNLELFNHIAVSAGSSEKDFEKLVTVCEAIPELAFICLDVANGYSEHFVAFIKRVRGKFPTHTIFAGNVVTGEMVEELILSGADVVKVRLFDYCS